MRPRIFNDDELLRLIDVDNLSQAAAAKTLGVSRQAVYNRLRELRAVRAKTIAASPARLKRNLDHRIDAVEQLTQINARTLEILNQVEADPELALKCLAELRQQLRLTGDLYSQVYSIQTVDRFMTTLTEILKDVDEDAYNQFQKRFNAERALQSPIHSR